MTKTQILTDKEVDSLVRGIDSYTKEDYETLKQEVADKILFISQYEEHPDIAAKLYACFNSIGNLLLNDFTMLAETRSKDTIC